MFRIFLFIAGAASLLVPAARRSIFFFSAEVTADLLILLFVLLGKPRRGPALITAAAALLTADTLYALKYLVPAFPDYLFSLQVATYLVYSLSAAYYLFQAYYTSDPLEKVETGLFLVLFSCFTVLQIKYVAIPVYASIYASSYVYILTTAHRVAESAVLAMAVLLGMKARSRYWFYMLNGLTLLPLSSFAIGYSTTTANGVPFEEYGWVFGLLFILSAQTCPLKAGPHFAKWSSIRVRLVWFVSLITLALLLLLYLMRAFVTRDAFHLTSSLFFIMFGAWFVANLIALRVSEDMHALMDGLESPSTLTARSGFRLSIYEAELFAEKLRLAYETIRSQSRMAALAALSAQVAHDIRSPLAALDSALKDIGQLPEEKRQLISGAAGRIRDIADDLLGKNREARAAAGQGLEACQLSSLIEPVVAEKRAQFRDRKGVSIEFVPEPGPGGLFALVRPVEFERILSNLINNGVESLEGCGSVTLRLLREKDKVAVTFSDNGRGIPPEVLPRIGRIGETHGKAGGSGLGLHHARTTVEGWGGSLAIRSETGEGTTVTLTLPQAARPGSPAPENADSPPAAGGRWAVLLDDDALVHLNWKMAARSAGINLSSYKKAGEFLAAAGTLPKDTPVYIDSELGGGVLGEDIAKDLHEKGFSDITMSTGHSPERFRLLPWLKVSGKEPPWGGKP